MNYSMIINILEIALLAAVFLFILRFILLNYTSKVRKPAAWINAVKHGEISPQLRHAEKKYPDRIRFYNLWLQITRLEKEGVEGDFAELGVYKGETARVIHLCAPARKLHLFDTFDGFPADDLQEETGKAAGYTSEHFADSKLEKVKQQFKNLSNVHFHVGYFPATTSALGEVKFALVSIDADLYKPTAAGIDFFFPRLSPGGIILVHDYNTDWPGLMKAVDDFCHKNSIAAVPVPDADSTVMIIKN
jgi:O-methyltransferase